MSAAPRVLIACWTSRLVGGAERYAEQSIAALASRGIPVALLAEDDALVDRPRMELPPAVPLWSGRTEELADVARWKPTLVIDHHVRDPAVRAGLEAMAPVVFVSHNYVGTCISGEKTHKAIVPRACSRTLGWPCLLHYFPNHCGGWSARTMARRWRTSRADLERVRAGAGVLALSRHMADEYVRHGVSRDRVAVAPPPIRMLGAAVAPAPSEPWRVLFVGRVELLKGTRLLLDALPGLARRLGRPVEATIVGDGPDRAHVARQAATLQAGSHPVRVRLTGWLARAAVEEELRRHHLLAIPSVWPEPFGLVGLEAAAAGLPTVAFDVGGISDWLRDGESGVLVRDEPRTAAAFATGLATALADVATWTRLAAGAHAVAASYTPDRFADDLVKAVQRWHDISPPRTGSPSRILQPTLGSASGSAP